MTVDYTAIWMYNKSMRFIINYWRNPSGKAPVEKYIDDIDNKEERAEILATLNGKQQHGTDAIGVEFRQIEGKLWELKIKTHGNQHRIFYVVTERQRNVFAPCVYKKDSKSTRE